MSNEDPPSSKPALPLAAQAFKRAGSIARKIAIPTNVAATHEPKPDYQGNPSTQDLRRLAFGDRVKFFYKGRILEGVVLVGPTQRGRGISGVIYEVETSTGDKLEIPAVKLISYTRKGDLR